MADDQKTSARGTTGADGSCQVTTFEPNDGAIAGRHIVLVAEPPQIGDADEPYTGPRISKKFSSVETSGLEVNVTDDDALNQFTLTVTSK